MLRAAPGLITMLAAALVAVPVVSVGVNVLSPGTGATWAHLAATVLPEYIGATLVLCLGVGLGSVLLGVGSAWLVTHLDFRCRRSLEWALVLPLAMPAYVMAYAYADLLQFAGPVQTALREATGWTRRDYWFPDVRSLGGAVVVLSCVLYPYVYLLSRIAFLERGATLLDAGRALGLTPWRSFLRVSLPMARPAIVGGAALALMETLADYGTVSYFGVQTFTTGIYRAWFALGDRTAAAQLSMALLAFVAIVLVAERLSRGGARFAAVRPSRSAAAGIRLAGWRAGARGRGLRAAARGRLRRPVARPAAPGDRPGRPAVRPALPAPRRQQLPARVADGAGGLRPRARLSPTRAGSIRGRRTASATASPAWATRSPARWSRSAS